MPNQRGPGQKLICFSLDRQFLAAIDLARGAKTRSQFVREAIFREVSSSGIRLDPKIIFPPDRARQAIELHGSNAHGLRATEEPKPWGRKKKSKKK
jgi:hypothetical protein